MKRIKQIILLITLISQSMIVLALQDLSSDKTVLDKGNVESQIDFVIDKSSSYEDYKVIKKVNLNILRAHILDSIKGAKKKLKETQRVVVTKNIQIDSLRKELQSTNDQLATIVKEKNAISFLGMSMAKQYYNSLIWTIIIGLISFLVFFVVLFRRGNVVTAETKKDLLETKQEFENHRKRTLEREEKLSRKYLDELNKYKQQMNTPNLR
jgi:hypothetical protein